MRIFLLVLITLPVFATQLIDYNIYDRHDRVDLMLSFDSAYRGEISQKKDDNLTLLVLSDLKYAKEELKNLNSKLVDKVSISSKDNNTYIMLQNREQISLEVSSINDKFGIRIRALKQDSALTPSEELDLRVKNPQGYDYTKYILVIALLLLLLIVLWWIRRSLFFKNRGISRDFRVVFQRFLDKNNQFVIFEYANRRYTMIIGNSNIILDNIEIQNYEDTQGSQESFHSFFEQNKRRIQSMIEKQKKKI